MWYLRKNFVVLLFLLLYFYTSSTLLSAIWIRKNDSDIHCSNILRFSWMCFDGVTRFPFKKQTDTMDGNWKDSPEIYSPFSTQKISSTSFFSSSDPLPYCPSFKTGQLFFFSSFCSPFTELPTTFISKTSFIWSTTSCPFYKGLSNSLTSYFFNSYIFKNFYRSFFSLLSWSCWGTSFAHSTFFSNPPWLWPSISKGQGLPPFKESRKEERKEEKIKLLNFNIQ